MSVNAILEQYRKNASDASSKKMTSDERLRQYFTTFLPKGVNSKTKRIRILPVGENKSPFIEVKGHKTEVNGQWRTFLCPKHEKDEDCPFCEAREALLSTGEAADKDLAKKYYPRLMYVVKVIDRDNEEDGPKFWRFNHDFRKTGTLDKIMGVVSAISDSSAPDLTDAETGRDLVITINRDQNNIPTVSSIAQGDPKPIHADAEIMESWLADDRTWESVYSIKTYDYLEIIVKGGEPTWQRDPSGDGGKWVDKNQLEDTESGEEEGLTIGGDVEKTDKPTVKVKTDEPQAKEEIDSDSEDEEDDLPF